MNKYNNVTFNIAFSGMMLSLVLLFQYLEKFMPIGPFFMKFNFSILFVLATFRISGIGFGIIILVLRFAIGPAFSEWGYIPLGIWSQFVLLFAGIIYVATYLISFKLLKFKKEISNMITSLALATLITTLTMIVFNAILFSPVYWWILELINNPTISNAQIAYEGVYKLAFLGIKNYWLGMLTVFFLGNAAKYTLISIVFVPLQKAFKH